MNPELTLDIRSDVYLGPPHPEDGERKEELAFYVIAVLPTGQTFRHKHSFTTEKYGHNRNHKAEIACDDLLMKIVWHLEKGLWAGPKDNPYWEETYPQYGSVAWLDYEQNNNPEEED